jgi:hypothetical protein
LDFNGHASGHDIADVVETGIAPVLTFFDLWVR